MHYFGSDNYYETSTISIIGDSDIKILLNIYLPIIGYKAFSLYQYLLNEIENKPDEISSIENLCKYSQFSLGDLTIASSSLEGMGLLKTYLKEENNVKFIKFVLYPPKSPRDFFDDILFNGMLIHHIGKPLAQQIALKYEINLDLTDYKDISSSFVDVYNPDFEDDIYLNPVKGDIKGRKKGRIKSEFDIGMMLDALEKSSNIKSGAFSKKEIKEIERIATLFNLDELTMIEIVLENFDINKKQGERVNIEQVITSSKEEARYLFISNPHKRNKKSSGGISSDSDLGKLINLACSLSPNEFLAQIQGGIAPAKSDLNLIESLSSEFQLNNEVINVLLSYVIQVKNNQLPRSYCEKIAGTLVRANIETAVDAVGYLNNSNKNNNASKKIEEKNNDEDSDIMSEEEIRRQLKEMEGK